MGSPKRSRRRNYRVSVVINTFRDDQDELIASINSYLSQYGVKVQVIVSTLEGDPSIVTIGRLYRDDARVEMCVSTNQEHPGRGPQGIFYQLNKALPLVNGAWFTYASGNDIALPTKCYEEITLCREHGKDVCYSSFYVASADLQKILQKDLGPYSHFKHLQGNIVSDCAMMKTSLLRRYGPFDLSWENHAYWDFWLRVFRDRGDVFYYNEHPTWLYRLSDDSQHVQRAKDADKHQKNIDMGRQLISDHASAMPIARRAMFRGSLFLPTGRTNHVYLSKKTKDSNSRSEQSDTEDPS